MPPEHAPEPWLHPNEVRIGLGCMRLSTDADRSDDRALATVAAAIGAGITVFDTARAYGHGESDLGHNERLLARAIREAGAAGTARIVTKGGMGRPGGAWVPDGRARTIRSDCEASLDALGGLAVDTYLCHAPDPRTPWATTVRALARLQQERLVRRIGISNVTRRQLEEALSLAPIAAVQVALGPLDDTALRSGLFERCVGAGVTVIAHSPLGGPTRAARVDRHEALAAVASAHRATPAEIALAWILALDPAVVAVPGARRPETARSAAAAARIALPPAARATLDRRLRPGASRATTRPGRAGTAGAADAADVVVIMGIPGAGKTRAIEPLVAAGYHRLNRDERGGTLAQLTAELDRALATGAHGVVLDNTYLTRAQRNAVIETAAAHGAPVRCVWLDTPVAQAQVNLVERLLDLHGALPGPDELKALARRHAGVMAPASQLRAVRELERPEPDEGFSSVEIVPFTRAPRPERRRAGVFVAAAALAAGHHLAVDRDADAPHLVFDWLPDGSPGALEGPVATLRATTRGPVASAVCPHGGGPPRCWCRPPLPGLLLDFSRTHHVDPARSLLIGTSRTHRALADTLGAAFAAPAGA